MLGKRILGAFRSRVLPHQRMNPSLRRKAFSGFASAYSDTTLRTHQDSIRPHALEKHRVRSLALGFGSGSLAQVVRIGRRTLAFSTNFQPFAPIRVRAHDHRGAAKV